MTDTDVSTPAPADPITWNPAKRLAFRLVFCYFMVYALCCGNATLWEVIPFHIGEKIENGLNWPFAHAAQWLSLHMFHFHGIGSTLHDSGSGDRLLDWLSLGVMLAVALLATIVWAIADRRRAHYRRLFGWMRFTLRIAIGVAMINYGLAKVLPLQMAPPSLAVLNEPLGNTSPMTLLWTTIGLNPLYEMICGAIEVLAGVLILFRRTALAGALFTAFVVSNVVLYNYFFDVPVKIYATHLLLMSLVVVAPDLNALADFFLRHRAAVPTGNWMLPANRRTLRRETLLVATVLVLTIAMSSVNLVQGYSRQRAAVAHPSPLAGWWHVDSATLNGQPHAYLSGEHLAITDFYLEPTGRAMARDTSAQLWRGGYRDHPEKKSLQLGVQAHGGGAYSYRQPDATHLILTPTGDDAKTESVLTLTRVPTPATYPLEKRGFHFVNEWGLER